MLERMGALSSCLFLVLAGSCSDEDTGSSASSGTGADAAPPSGVWTYMDGGIQKNTCGTDEVYSDPDTQFVLTDNGDGTFEVDQGAEGTFTCTLDGPDFECPERLLKEMPIDMTDVTVTWTVSVSGRFSSDTEMSGEQRADLICEGSQCDLVAGAIGATLPCYYTVAFTATAN